MLQQTLVGWYVLVALSAAYVAWDTVKYNPEVPVMKWAFVLITLYTGPIGPVSYTHLTLPTILRV